MKQTLKRFISVLLVFAMVFAIPSVSVLAESGISRAVLFGSLTASSSKVRLYENTTLTAKASGGTGDYQYRFRVHNLVTDGYDTVQEYSSKNSCTWMAGAVGTRELFVDIKDSSGKVYTDVVYIDVFSSDSDLEGTLVTSNPNPAIYKQITLTANASKGAGGYQYRFRVHNLGTDGRDTVQDYSSKNSCVWLGGSIDRRELLVDIKDSKGNVITRMVPVNVVSASVPALNGSLTASNQSPVIYEQITLMANASGGTGGYQYRFRVHNLGTDGKDIVQDYSSKNSCTWLGGSIDTRIFYVDIKDSNGTVITKEVQVNVQPKTPLSGSLTASNTNPKVLESITLTAGASGGTGGYQYRFRVHNLGTDGKDTVQDYSSQNTCTWLGGTVDTRILYVDIKDSSGTVVTQEVKVNVQPKEVLSGSLTASNTNPKVLETITLTAKASGGAGDYQYRFRVHNLGTGGNDTIQEYSSRNTCTWLGGTTDTRILYVDIKDRLGKEITEQVTVSVGEKTTFGIDVSSHNGKINWDKVKTANIDFAMIRIGYGNSMYVHNEASKQHYAQIDNMFGPNVAGARTVGIDYGLYYYSYAQSVEEAKKEAQVCLEILDRAGITPNDLEYPVAFDIEEPSRRDPKLKQENTDMVKAFLDIIEEAGYTPMVYCDKDFLTNALDAKQLSDYAIWMAQYNDEMTYDGKVDIWQYASDGSIVGIEGNVDLNEGYIDFDCNAGLPEYTAKTVIKTVTGDKVNVRNVPQGYKDYYGRTSVSLGTVDQGTKVFVFFEDIVPGWSYVFTETGLQGFISNTYLEK